MFSAVAPLPTTSAWEWLVRADRNPRGAIHRAMSMDLDVTNTPEVLLMATFFDCMALLHDLKNLEIFSTSYDKMFLGLKWESSQFPTIRELGINGAVMELVWKCPNVESATIRGTLRVAVLLQLHGKRLKRLRRIVGMREYVIESSKLKDTVWSEASIHLQHIAEVVQRFPYLQEICMGDDFELGAPDVSPCVGPSRLAHVVTYL